MFTVISKVLQWENSSSYPTWIFMCINQMYSSFFYAEGHRKQITNLSATDFHTADDYLLILKLSPISYSSPGKLSQFFWLFLLSHIFYYFNNSHFSLFSSQSFTVNLPLSWDAVTAFTCMSISAESLPMLRRMEDLLQHLGSLCKYEMHVQWINSCLEETTESNTPSGR